MGSLSDVYTSSLYIFTLILSLFSDVLYRSLDVHVAQPEACARSTLCRQVQKTFLTVKLHYQCETSDGLWAIFEVIHLWNFQNIAKMWEKKTVLVHTL